MEYDFNYWYDMDISTQTVILCVGVVISLCVLLWTAFRIIALSEDPYLDFDKFLSTGGDKNNPDAFKNFVSTRRLIYFTIITISLVSAVSFYTLIVKDLF